MQVKQPTKKWIGASVERIEDRKFASGKGTYVEDIDLPRMLYASIYRSPYAHAIIKKIDVDEVLNRPGVVAVVTGDEIAQQTNPVRARVVKEVKQYCMATGKVRFVGEPIVAIAATDQYLAEDALEFVKVEFEPLPPVVEIEDAIDTNSPLIFEEAGSNILWHDNFKYGDVDNAFKNADMVLRERFRVHRYSSTPLENWVIIAHYEPITQNLTVWSNDQQPGRSISNIADMLRIQAHKVRLIVPDIGGAFGVKLAIWPHSVIISMLSMKSGRPVKWTQDRLENLQGYTHAPDGILDVELAVDKDGEFRAIRVNDTVNDGSFIHTAGIYSMIKFAVIVGNYAIKNVEFDAISVVTNKAPTVQNRGVGKPTMNFVLERMVDLAAKKLGLDPADIRFRNYIQPDQFPYTTPSGEVYDSGNYPEALKKCLKKIEYVKFRNEQKKLWKQHRYMGIGLSSGIEPGTSNLGYYYVSGGNPTYVGAAEGATVGIDPGGSITAVLGSIDSGQGHITAVTQVLADEFGVDLDDISVHPEFDTRTSPYVGSSGTYSNKFNDVDIGAVIGAAKLVKEKMLKIASHVLKVDPEDLVMNNKRIFVRKREENSVTFQDVATLAYKTILMLPSGMEPGLQATYVYRSPYTKFPDRKDFNVQITHSNSVHAAVVEVDTETGVVTIKRYVIVHDCGNLINPKIVEGLTVGSTLHGIAASLLEEFVYDKEGQILTTSFMNYLKPTTMEAPYIEIETMSTPSPFTVLGTKAAGEGGSIPSLAAVANAVEDALTPFNIRITELPLTPEKILRWIQKAKR